MNQDAQIWDKWKRWLETADADFTQIQIRRQMWRRFNEMLEEAPDDGALKTYGGSFVKWVASMYVDSQAIAIRRQSDKGKDVITLGRILENMKANHHVVIAFSQTPATIAEIELELDRLTQISKEVREVVNKRIAHWDRKDKQYEATFGNLHQSIDQLGVLMQRCYSIIHNAGMEIEVTEADPWGEIFHHPWLPNPQ